MRSYLEILIELKEVLDSDMEMPRVFKKKGTCVSTETL